MEYLTNEEAVDVIKNNAKEWFKRNWKKVAIGTLAFVGIGLAVAKAKSNDSNNEDNEGEEILNILKNASADIDKETLDILKNARSHVPNSADIDENIYTSLALEIEDAVLCEGLDEAYMDRTYTVKYPKGGNSDNGYYDVKKKVMVHVVDIGDEEDWTSPLYFLK